jgi:hypothetical protein
MTCGISGRAGIIWDPTHISVFVCALHGSYEPKLGVRISQSTEVTGKNARLLYVGKPTDMAPYGKVSGDDGYLILHTHTHTDVTQPT